jgi:hypothetical protein
MKYNILKDEIYRTSYLIYEPLFLEEDGNGRRNIGMRGRVYWEESIV